MSDGPDQTALGNESEDGLLTPAIARRDGGQYRVTVRGIPQPVAESKATAIAYLCRVAIERGESLVVTLSEGAGRSYLAIDSRGQVQRTSAPAPHSLRADLADDGTNPYAAAQASTEAWVQDRMLDDEVAEPPRRRRLFGRR